MADPNIEQAKAALRLRARSARAAVSAAARAEAAKSVAAHFFTAIPLDPTTIVAGYWKIKDEMDCLPIIAKLMDSGQPVCLPVVLGDDQPLSLRLWEQGTPLYESGFGTLAPSELAPQVEPDLIIVPLLGFDARGTRLGYGGGYYDRTLARLAKKPRLVGIAFAAQEIAEIPHEAHDMPLDMVITENGARFFERAAA